jgi:ribose 5-phosphate isomerase A
VNKAILEFKQQAAERAVEFVESGMVVGLGHGSTAIFAVRRIAELLQASTLKEILGVPCSTQVEAEAQQLGIPLTTLEEHPVIDLTIDGADEVAPNLDLIKGAGGALLREKIVAQASLREIIVVDESKLSLALGTHKALPIEVTPFGWRAQAAYLESIGARVSVRHANKEIHFKTDQGNLILDCTFGPIEQPALFLGLATDIIVGGAQGVRHLRRNQQQ